MANSTTRTTLSDAWDGRPAPPPSQQKQQQIPSNAPPLAPSHIPPNLVPSFHQPVPQQQNQQQIIRPMPPAMSQMFAPTPPAAPSFSSQGLLDEINTLFANSEQYVLQNVNEMQRATQAQLARTIEERAPPTDTENKGLQIATLVIVAVLLIAFVAFFFWQNAKWKAFERLASPIMSLLPG